MSGAGSYEAAVARGAKALGQWVNPTHPPAWALGAARVVLGAAWPCRNCGGPLMPEPLMPEGYVHANGEPLCPGHSTVSSDGSNSARPPDAKDREEGS